MISELTCFSDLNVHSTFEFRTRSEKYLFWGNINKILNSCKIFEINLVIECYHSKKFYNQVSDLFQELIYIHSTRKFK